MTTMLFTTICKIRSGVAALAAAVLCCASCVTVDNTLGGNLVPIDKQYDIFSAEIPLDEIYMCTADSLDARSMTRINIGAIRDEEGQLTTRGCAMTLVPVNDSIDFGESPVFKSFVFDAILDSVSVADENQKNIIQNVKVYELSEPMDPLSEYNCNAPISHKGVSIVKGSPTINGSENLSFSFTKEFGQKFLDNLTQADLKDFDSYVKKFPGIYIETDNPVGRGGRFNMFELQLGWDAGNSYLMGSVASLTVTTKYKGWQNAKDTSFLFYFGATDFVNVDSLISSVSRGSYPEVCFNVTGGGKKESRKAEDYIYIEGGGGFKPVIKASTLAKMVSDVVSAHGGKPETVFINKASIILPYVYDPEKYEQMYKYPQMLSPTARIRYTDTTGRSMVNFNGLTDSSASEEDPGDIDRSNLKYAPDITYHMQSILKKSATDPEALEKGDYDVWLLIMAYETTTTTDVSSSNMDDYYQYLAYQSYYNNMYGGYGGYGGYGYGGYGGYGYNNYYSNYYSYMMASMYANSNNTTTTTDLQLDKDRYYRGVLYGPTNKECRPTLKLTISVPRDRD